jgi:hypothetical protein
MKDIFAVVVLSALTLSACTGLTLKSSAGNSLSASIDQGRS